MRCIAIMCLVACSAQAAWLLDGQITDARPTTVEQHGKRTVNAAESDVVAAGGVQLDGAAADWEVVDGQARRIDTNALEAAWVTSPERAKRAGAINIVTIIKSTLAQIGVTPRERAQVISDVTAWVASGPGEKSDRLEVSLRLMLAYERLAELVGDTTGLISGTRAVSLDRTKPSVIAVTP